MSAEQIPNRYVPKLDEMLTREQCAAWTGQSERWLQENEDKIIPFRMTKKTVMYHPRTILANAAFKAGVPIEVVAASYGVVDYPKKP